MVVMGGKIQRETEGLENTDPTAPHSGNWLSSQTLWSNSPTNWRSRSLLSCTIRFSAVARFHTKPSLWLRAQIHCEERGEVEIRGIAYPVPAYPVVDSHENLDQVRQHSQELHPNIKLDIDLQAMTSADRAQATAVLLRALDTIADAKQTRVSRKTTKDSETGH